jgi:predicted ATPase/DNA-binding SARP family transcriptional activator
VDFRILGPLVVNEVPLGGPRQRGVLALLLLHANESVSAERLVLGLWGEEAPPSGLKSLQVAVSRLRRELGAADVVETTASGYRIHVGPGELDLDRFEGAAAAGRESLAAAVPARAAEQLREALDEWRGPALADVAGVPFAAAEIARLEEQRLEVLEARVEADLAVGRHAELVGELRALVAEHPWRERLHAHLMLALYRTGRQADALDAYAAARAALVEQLGIEPGPELRSRQAAILAHDPALAPPGTARATALPRPPDLFGREADLARVCDQVRSARLVTLVGPGGVGKTSLALAAAHRLQVEFADGARFVRLAAVADPGELEGAIERALAVPEDRLRRYLADRELLLVLDNFEQLVTGAPLVGELLADAPRLTVLVTSREATRLAAERVFALEPLAGEDAVDLFADRVRAREPDFEPDESVPEICERLDGLPLAVELAAARIGLLSAAELAVRLDHALPVLTGGARDAPERQQTLRATIDWSYELLDAAEREAFARFAVFAGGATVAAAEAITGAGLDTLQSLADKQLLRRRGQRLTMLALVREYALERLAPEDGVHGRLAAWCIALAESEVPRAADSAEARASLDAELPNAIAAMRWALASGADETAADLVIAWGQYWFGTDRRADGRAWTAAALERAVDPDRQARLLLTRGLLTGVRQRESFQADLEAALTHFRAADDVVAVAECLGQLAFAHAWVDEYEVGVRLADEAVHFAERSGDDRALARALQNRALVSEDFDAMAAAARPALAVLRKGGHLHDVSGLCSTTGFVAVAERRDREAIPWLEEAIEAARASSSRELSVALGNLGLAKLFLGDLDGAETVLVEALVSRSWSVTDPRVDETVLTLGAVYALRGDLDRAAVLAGMAAANPTPGRHADEERVMQRLNDELLDPARARATTAAWEEAAARGAAMNLRDVVELVQQREPVGR